MRFNPTIGSDLSGHLGGVVASHNTYGVYLKRRVHPVNNKTAPQLAVRSAFQVVSQSWRGLDAGEQLAWTTASIVKKSRKGFIVTLSGQAAYMWVNILRQYIGLALIDAPPVSPDPAELTLPTVSVTAPNTYSVTYTDTDPWNASGGGVLAAVGGPLSAGVAYWQKFRHAGSTLGPVTSPWVQTLPMSVVAGNRLRFRFHVTDPSGRMSVPVDVDATAA
jgi:hypothetical protein